MAESKSVLVVPLKGTNYPTWKASPMPYGAYEGRAVGDRKWYREGAS